MPAKVTLSTPARKRPRRQWSGPRKMWISSFPATAIGSSPQTRLRAAQKTLQWRKLNLCASGEETAVLVQAGNENILINSTLRGHLLRDAIYDAKGLEPSAITRVICLKSDPQHTLDVPIMKNAQLYLPKRTLEAEKQSTENGPRHLAFNASGKNAGNADRSH